MITGLHTLPLIHIPKIIGRAEQHTGLIDGLSEGTHRAVLDTHVGGIIRKIAIRALVGTELGLVVAELLPRAVIDTSEVYPIPIGFMQEERAFCHTGSGVCLCKVVGGGHHVANRNTIPL